MITIPAALHMRNISYNAKKALLKGILLGGASILAYVIVVIMTTPQLPASFAIRAAFGINPIIIYGMGFGVGLNTFVSSYSRRIGCRIDKKRKGIFGISSGSTALSGFFSFFSLVPLGCCGSMLLILSYLPTIFGTALSVSLIQYSKSLSYLGLLIVLSFAGISSFKLLSELKRQRQQQLQQQQQHGGIGEQNIDKKSKRESSAVG